MTHEFDWDYDALDRLIEEIHVGTGPDSGDDYTTTYSFDLVGNRVEMTTDSDDALKDRTVTYSYDDNDRLLTETSNAVTGDDTHTIYSWGNATGTVGGTATQQTGKKVWESLDTSGDVLETVTYAYNLQGRLAQATIVKGGDTTVLTYTYDDSGIRVGQTETINAGTPVITQYLIDHNNHTGYQQVLEEFVDAVLAKSYTIGLDVLAQTNADTTPDTYQFLYDAHGSARALLDTLAIIAQTYAYDAYGNALGFNTATALTSLLYSGEQFDQKLAMQYLRARFYDAGTGRFNRVDPFAGNVGNPISLHKYTYSHNNPVNQYDPSGLWSLTEMKVIAAIQATMFTLNLYGFIENTKQSTRYFVNAISALSAEDYNTAGAYIVLSLLYGGLASWNAIGMITAGKVPPPPTSGVGMLASAAAAGDGGARFWQSVSGLATPEVKEWIAKQAIPAVLALFAKRVDTSRHQSLSGQPRGPNSGPEPTNPIRKAGLPQRGLYRYVPPDSWNPSSLLPTRVKNGIEGFLDRHGNIWQKGPNHHFPGAGPHEWDVQFPGGGYMNVSFYGEIAM